MFASCAPNVRLWGETRDLSPSRPAGPTPTAKKSPLRSTSSLTVREVGPQRAIEEDRGHKLRCPWEPAGGITKMRPEGKAHACGVSGGKWGDLRGAMLQPQVPDDQC